MLRHDCPEELIFVLPTLYTDISIKLNHIKNQYLPPAAMKNKYSKCESPLENHVEAWLSLGPGTVKNGGNPGKIDF